MTGSGVVGWVVPSVGIADAAVVGAVGCAEALAFRSAMLSCPAGLVLGTGGPVVASFSVDACCVSRRNSGSEFCQ